MYRLNNLTLNVSVPVHLTYDQCKCLELPAGTNVELIVLTVINSHAIMVMPKVSLTIYNLLIATVKIYLKIYTIVWVI